MAAQADVAAQGQITEISREHWQVEDALAAEDRAADESADTPDPSEPSHWPSLHRNNTLVLNR